MWGTFRPADRMERCTTGNAPLHPGSTIAGRSPRRFAMPDTSGAQMLASEARGARRA